MVFVQLPSRRRPHRPWAAALLAVLAITAYLVLIWSADDPARHAALLQWGTLSASPAQWRQFWHDGRLVNLFTALFIHASLWHLLGNGLFLPSLPSQIGALYPVTTVLLARGFLGDDLEGRDFRLRLLDDQVPCPAKQVVGQLDQASGTEANHELFAIFFDLLFGMKSPGAGALGGDEVGVVAGCDPPLAVCPAEDVRSVHRHCGERLGGEQVLQRAGPGRRPQVVVGQRIEVRREHAERQRDEDRDRYGEHEIRRAWRDHRLAVCPHTATCRGGNPSRGRAQRCEAVLRTTSPTPAGPAASGCRGRRAG